MNDNHFYSSSKDNFGIGPTLSSSPPTRLIDDAPIADNMTKNVAIAMNPLAKQYQYPRPNENTPMAKSDDGQINHRPSHTDNQRRQFLLLTASLLLSSQFPSRPANAVTTTTATSPLSTRQNYQPSPINKRSGITLTEPERIYPLSFITYLSRFLLVFDEECRRYWYTQAQAIPAKSSKEEVDRLRLRQFGQFAASVEVGLMDFEGRDGELVKVLLDSLVGRYAGVALTTAAETTTKTIAAATTTAVGSGISSNVDGSGAAKTTREAVASSPSSKSSTAAVRNKPDTAASRKQKEALRQIAILFSLLETSQPVDSITQLLAAIDDASIGRIRILDGGAGYPPPPIANDPDALRPRVMFPDPPTMGTEFGGSTAVGKPVLRETGRLLRIDVVSGGGGYVKPPTVEIGVSNGEAGGNGTSRAAAKAVLEKRRGSVERIDVVDPGGDFTAADEIVVRISPPESSEGDTAWAKPVLEYEVAGIDVVDEGRGYAAEKPIRIVIDPPPKPTAGGAPAGVRPAVAVAYPKGKYTSYASYANIDGDIDFQRMTPDIDNIISASESYADTASSLVTGPTSSQLLSLLPSGFGVQFDTSLQRYVVTGLSSSETIEDVISGTLEGKSFKPINFSFGPRGRSPIEREKNLDTSTILRFMASGAICSSLAHVTLTPIDVVKTKVQTDDRYNSGIVGTFRQVWEEEGPATFFDGWEPTFAGFFVSGAFGFFLTEFFRRFFASLLKDSLMNQSSLSEVCAAAVTASYDIPLIVAGASTAAFVCCFILAPFDSVRIRRVSQPDYADNIFGVVSRMSREEGFLSLFSTVPVWWIKEIPFNAAKFLTFDTSTEYLYETFPIAREDIRLSLVVSLVGGTLGGIAAAIVSNPGDAVVSVLKKAKTDLSAIDAAKKMNEKEGLNAFFKGLPLRMIFYSLLVSLQFLLYDFIRFSLGVGSDDMKLYLNVLGAALSGTSGS